MTLADDPQEELRTAVLRSLVTTRAERDPLREMAEAVLAGELTLRQAASTDLYGEALFSAYEQADHEQEKWSEEQRSELAAQAARLNSGISESEESR